MTISVYTGIDRTDLAVSYDFNDLSSFDYRQNILTYSEQLNNAAWTRVASGSISADVAIAPDGTLTADKFYEDATTAEHTIYYQQTVSNVTQTWSIYAKAGERTQIALTMSNFLNADARAYFDLIAGTVITTSGTNADYSNISGAIVSVGNGWHRCSLTATKGAVNTTNHVSVMGYIHGTGTVYASTTGTGFYLWGAQLATSNTPGNYVQTVASAVNVTKPTTVVNRVTAGTYDGTVVGAPYHRNAKDTMVSDVNIGSMQFATSSGEYGKYITASGIPASFWQGSWTASMWVYFNQLSWQRNGGPDHVLIGHGPGYITRQGLHLVQRSDKFMFGFWGDDIWSTSSLSNSTWYNVTYSYDARYGRRKIYVNGVLENDYTYAPSLYSGAGTNTTFGSVPWGLSTTNLYGRMADIKLYNGMISDAQVARNFAATRGRYGV